MQEKDDIVEGLTGSGLQPGLVASPIDDACFRDPASLVSLSGNGTLSNVRRILVVETDRTLCKRINRHLTRAGFSVSVVHNGRDAYDESMMNNYDWILTDLWIPGMDGFEMIDAMRKSGVDAPIAILTAHITQEMMRELDVYDICKIMRKPVKLRDLVKVMQAHVA